MLRPFTFTSYLKYTAHWSTGCKPVVIHYVLETPLCRSLFSNRVLHDVLWSSHLNVLPSPQKCNSTTRRSRSPHKRNLNILLSLTGRCGGVDAGVEGQPARHRNCFTSFQQCLSCYSRFLALARKKQAFWPVCFFFFFQVLSFLPFLFLSFHFLIFPPSLFKACLQGIHC